MQLSQYKGLHNDRYSSNLFENSHGLNFLDSDLAQDRENR